MKRKLGTLCIVLGSVLILAALTLFLWNQKKEQNAEDAVKKILPIIEESIEKTAEVQTDQTDLEQETMTEIEVQGESYIGYLSLPTIQVKLPVMTDWSTVQLETAPCRYAGSVKTDDLVIIAHNYPSHFGNLKNIYVGDIVCFKDMDGIVYQYEVAKTDVVESTAIEEVTNSGFSLTLLTCTYSGQNRIAVWCEKVN